jgi:8-oxo-dGTP pyrophosphatase MutT (NUDIX family)
MREAVAILMYHPIDSNLILGVSRKHNSDDFGLPGGKVDPGETLEMAAKRELLEETGLTVDDIQSIFVAECLGEDEDYLVTTFLAECPAKFSLKTKEKGVPKWVTTDKLLSGSFGSYNKNLFEKISSLKCNHSSCANDGYMKPIPFFKRTNAVYRISGMPGDKNMFRCQKHFEDYDRLHQAVLASENTHTSKTDWNPNMITYIKLED